MFEDAILAYRFALMERIGAYVPVRLRSCVSLGFNNVVEFLAEMRFALALTIVFEAIAQHSLEGANARILQKPCSDLNPKPKPKCMSRCPIAALRRRDLMANCTSCRCAC